jgi:hypothetical protein
MSALPPKADIAERDENVRFVPIPDITGHYSITRQREEERRGRCCSRSGYCRVVMVSKLNPCSSRLPNDCPNEQ